METFLCPPPAAPGIKTLTEVKAHAEEDDEAEPAAEGYGEIHNSNYNISHGGEDAEYDVTVG